VYWHHILKPKSSRTLLLWAGALLSLTRTPTVRICIALSLAIAAAPKAPQIAQDEVRVFGATLLAFAFLRDFHLCRGTLAITCCPLESSPPTDFSSRRSLLQCLNSHSNSVVATNSKIKTMCKGGIL